MTETPKYTTTELIDRLYLEMENEGQAPKLKLQKPEVVIQNSKTFVSNFRDLCKRFKRSEDEVLTFFVEELRAKCTIDGNGALIIHKIFRQNQIQSILSKYMEAAVMCKQCKSYLTEIIRENRITYMSCEACRSKRAIA
jgi:translation initiation factor 2 subunit 2